MQKKKAKGLLGRIANLKIWQLVIIFILLAFLSGTLLRLNNVTMIQLRTAVIDADESGDSETIRMRLADLQNYVSGHMNTDLSGGVLLTETMKRDQESVVNVSNVNIYKQADAKCQSNKVYAAYFACMTSYLNDIPGGQVVSQSLFSASKVQLIYTHNFASPLWSPDFAGWSLVLCGLVFVLLVVRLLSVIFIHFLLRKHRNPI